LLWFGTESPSGSAAQGPLDAKPAKSEQTPVFDPDELLYSYVLEPDAELEPKSGAKPTTWTLEIYRHRGSKYFARMIGPAAESIKLVGKLNAHGVKTRDSETWIVAELSFEGKEARSLDIEIEYTEDSVDGYGTWIEGEATLGFGILEAKVLPSD
jgi:hypothetical protein